MALERIVLRLDPNIGFEQDIINAYKAMSRPRRQEWLRSLLRTGLADQSTAPKAAPAALVMAPVAAPAAALEPVAETNAPAIAAAVAPADPVATKTVKRSASLLSGFLPEVTAASKDA